MTSKILKISSNALVLAALMGSGVSYGKVYLFHIVLVLNLGILFLICRNDFIQHAKMFIQGNWELFGVVAILIISLLWSFQLSGGIVYISYWLMGLSLMLVTSFYSTKDEKFFLKVGLIFLLIQGGISFLESAGLMRMPLSVYSNLHASFGKTIQFSERKLLSLKESQDLSTGFFWNPNNSALFFLLALPFLNFVKNNLARICLVVFSVAVIYTTGSDAIFGLALIYLLGQIFFLGFNKLTILQKKKVLVALMTFFIVGTIFFFRTHENTPGDTFIPKVQGFFYIIPKFIVAKITGEPFDVNSVQEAIRERFFWLSSAIDLIKDSYGMGIGAGRIKSTQLIFEDRYMKMEAIHFYWLEIMMVSGVLGFLFFFKWYFRKFRALYGKSSPMARMCCHSMLLLLPGAIVLSSAVYYLPMYLLFGVMTGCAASKLETCKNP